MYFSDIALPKGTFKRNVAKARGRRYLLLDTLHKSVNKIAILGCKGKRRWSFWLNCFDIINKWPLISLTIVVIKVIEDNLINYSWSGHMLFNAMNNQMKIQFDFWVIPISWLLW